MGTLSARGAATLALAAWVAAGCSGGGDVERPLPPLADPPRSVSVVPHPGVPIEPDRSVVYCATIQLCWDALRERLGGDEVRLRGARSPEDVAAMNVRPFPPAMLDPASYVAMAGFAKEGVYERIRSALAEKFGEDAPETDFTEEFVAYAYLLKSLRFAEPFSRLDRPLRLARTHDVVAWGHTGDGDDPRAARMMEQAVVHAVPGEPGFVVEIAPKDARDRLILALLEPAATLEETWTEAARRMMAIPAWRLDAHDRLAVPIVEFGVEHRFAQFEGAVVENELLPGWVVTRAEQGIQFRLDERGAELRSYGAIVACMAPVAFEFDRPFLIALIERGADRPYLLVWVGETSLLRRAA